MPTSPCSPRIPRGPFRTRKPPPPPHSAPGPSTAPLWDLALCPHGPRSPAELSLGRPAHPASPHVTHARCSESHHPATGTRSGLSQQDQRGEERGWDQGSVQLGVPSEQQGALPPLYPRAWGADGLIKPQSVGTEARALYSHRLARKNRDWALWTSAPAETLGHDKHRARPQPPRVCVHVCMCAHVYVHVCMFIHVCSLYGLHLYMCVCVHMHVCIICVHAHMCVHTCSHAACMGVHMHVCICVCMCACVRPAWVCVCSVHVCICLYVCVHVCAHVCSLRGCASVLCMCVHVYVSHTPLRKRALVGRVLLTKLCSFIKEARGPARSPGPNLPVRSASREMSELWGQLYTWPAGHLFP